MNASPYYAIRGGLQGRERLRVLARVMRPTTIALFERVCPASPSACLDAGCGGGDATLDLARRVAPGGTVIGADIDEVKLQIARADASLYGIANVEFRVWDVRAPSPLPPVDFLYARFLLTHLADPAGAVAAFHRQLRPGGVIALEDIDFSGHFTWPESPAFRRYHQLYCETVTRRGGDPNVGLRLPALLADAGFEDVGVGIVQPIALAGEAKLMNPLTMENIAPAVLADGLAAQDEVDRLVDELYAFAADPSTLAGPPRVVQAWGTKAIR
jgi:SAM-dependent methyltransferase